ncbi:MAG: glycerol-3-phosphate dehydrogenase, partial [Bacilli bacterium]|nr:glycerol-3-phosphate dehydrogenase [Bacilli bacterium]
MTHQMKSTTVLGAGGFGTALAQVLAENGHQVQLYARRAEYAAVMQQTRTNPDYLPEVKLSKNITVTHELEEAVRSSENIVVAVPTAGFRDIVKAASVHISSDVRIVHATKGFDSTQYQRMSEVLCEELPQVNSGQIAVITGPSHAEEVAKRCPTTVVVASYARETAEWFQDLFMSRYLRVYTNPDVIGAEVAGALKNVIALGCGISDGLGYGDNAKAALMTRGLTEISRLGVAMGASSLTFAGLAGIGDLVVTCTSQHSRNWRAGYRLGQGEQLEKILSASKMVIEGVRTTLAARHLAVKYQIELPITDAIYHVLFEN